MTMERWKVGSISITKVEETDSWQPFETWLHIMPRCTPEEIERMQWLKPAYLRDEGVNLFVHSLLVETPTRKIVIDTGIGNGKKRVSPLLDNLDSDFLERFEQVWSVADVDGVVPTHLHLDHVGWNTRLEAGKWVPTFPNARYYFVRAEFEHWRAYAQNPLAANAFSEFAQAMMEQCLKPVVEPEGAYPPGCHVRS